MGEMWIMDIRDFVDDKGRVFENIAEPLRSLLDQLGAIIMDATVPSDPNDPQRPIRCRRTIRGVRCPGIMSYMFVPGGEERILWRCTGCGENGDILHWQGSIWDCRTMGVLS